MSRRGGRRSSFAPRRGAPEPGGIPEEVPEPGPWTSDPPDGTRALAFALLGQFMQQGMLTAQALSVCEQVRTQLNQLSSTPEEVYAQLDDLARAYQAVIEAQGYLLGVLNQWAAEEAEE